MNRSRIAIALCALALSAVPSMAQTPAAAPAATKIAIANPIKILNELAETKEVNKAMESEQAGFRGDVAKREQNIKDLTAQRDQLKADSQQWRDLDSKIATVTAEAKQWVTQSQRDQLRRFRDQAKRMNDKIGATLKEIASAKKIDLVIADQKPEISDAQMESMNNPQQIMGLLFGRPVLYSSDTIDLTQEAIAKLDAAYKAK